MILQLLALLWLISGLVGLWAWTRCLVRSQARLAALRRSGRNGVLREIGLYASRTNALGLIVSVLILLVLVNAMVIPPGEARTIGGRTLVILIALCVAVQGMWRDLNDTRIDRAIQNMTTAQVEEAAKDG